MRSPRKTSIAARLHRRITEHRKRNPVQLEKAKQYQKRYREEQKPRQNNVEFTQQQLNKRLKSRQTQDTKQENTTHIQQSSLQPGLETTSTTSYDMSLIERVLSDDVRCLHAIGMTEDEVEKLYERCKPKFEVTTMRGEVRSRPASLPQSLSDFKQLFITLLFLRQYPLMSMLSIIFNIHERTLTRIIERCLIVLDDALKEEITWPSEDEMKNSVSKFESFQLLKNKSYVACVDGTEIRVPRPKDKSKQRKHFSVKKHQHSLNFLFVTLLNGVIIFVSKHFVNANDQAMFNKTGIRKKFEGRNYGLLADGGFSLNRKRDSVKIIGATPYKRYTKLTAHQQTHNTKISKMRAVIENTFSQLKNWRVLKTIFRHYSPSKSNSLDVDSVVRVVAYLTNMKIKQNPLRESNWTPPPMLSNHS